MLQQQLHTATPQQKAAIVQQIGATNDLIDQAKAQLTDLEAALSFCLGNHIDFHDVVVVGLIG